MANIGQKTSLQLKKSPFQCTYHLLEFDSVCQGKGRKGRERKGMGKGGGEGEGEWKGKGRE